MAQQLAIKVEMKKSMMKMKLLALLLLLFLMGCGTTRKASDKLLRPYNIVFIVADDLGRSDVGSYGNTFIETPNLDRMAASGVKFRNAYAAAPLCSPTRASIITGHNPARMNMTEHLHGYAPPPPSQKLSPPRIITGLPPALTTIPEALKTVGYVSGHFGKWHLGSGPSSPANSGFDTTYGGGQEGLPKTFFYPFFNGQPYRDLLSDSKEGDYLDDVLTTRAIQFMQNNRQNRFFLQLNFYSPHVPIEGKPALVKKYAEKRQRTAHLGLPENEYAAMVESIDQNVGRVLAYLQASGLGENTIVIFTSDNGGLHVQEVPAFAKHTPPTTNAPLRGGKGYIYEGGIREPWMVWAPSLVKKGREESTIVSTDDLFNTAMQLAGIETKSPDGKSILPLILGQSQPPRDYALHFPHYSPQRGKPGAVLRRGKFKLIEWYEDGKLELFDLEKDESESVNIAADHPTLVGEMKAALDAWRLQTGAKMPTPNPTYQKE
jgi:arylsulfatase A